MLKKILILVLFFISSCVNASDFGTTGVIDTPNARMMIDGELDFNFSSQKIANISNITYQATPWLQTTFRYTIFNPDNPIRKSIDGAIDGLSDRSYSAKIRLLRESKFRPEIALGFRDMIGTGAWNSEYIVLSKSVNNFDLSIGLGWGRLAESNSIKNPLIKINDSFKDSKYSGGKYGGKIRFGNFFRGEKAGIFGGLKYKIPNSKLTFLAEYNSDSYKREISYRTIPKSSPLSYGLEWKSNENFRWAITYQQGNQLGVSISSKLNTKYKPFERESKKFYSSYDGYNLSGAPTSLDLNSWYDSLFFDLDRAGILLRKAKILPENGSIEMELSNFGYSSSAISIRRALLISQIHIPSDITKLIILINENNHKVLRVNYIRDINSREFRSQNSQNIIKFSEPVDIENPTNYTKFIIPNTIFNTNIATKFQIFDPDQPIKHQVYLKVNSSTSLSQNINLFGSFAFDINNNFNETRGANSNLPHVRTDLNKYLTRGSSGIESLYIENRSTLYQNIYYRAYLGILEQMYSGVGIEFLYMPYKSRFAFGSSFNHLKKRGYERNLKMLDYEVSTAFMSVYYASPFYNYDFALHFGRYLAKDNGFTIEARRTFDNGFSVGAFASFTDVSSADYGEGSFDKGLFFSIPLEYLVGINTKSSFSTIIRSVQRDGGQRLEDFSGRLWHDLRGVRYDSFFNNRDEMIPR